jgi:hypothetical protein
MLEMDEGEGEVPDQLAADVEFQDCLDLIPLDDDGMVEPASHKERIFLDCDIADAWWVTDTITGESHKLDHGPWELNVHPDSHRAVLVCGAVNAKDESVVVDDLMKKAVYCSGTSDYIIVEKDRDGHSKESLLSTLKVRMKDGTLGIRIGVTVAFAQVVIFMFRLVRTAGCRFYFSTNSLYTVLGLDQYKGKASKWIYNTREAFEKALTPFFGFGTIVYSTECTVPRIELLPFADKCLPRLARTRWYQQTPSGLVLVGSKLLGALVLVSTGFCWYGSVFDRCAQEAGVGIRGTNSGCECEFV